MVFLVIFTFLGFITGYIISNKYKNRYLIVKYSKDFFEYYKLKLGFSQDKIFEIINDYNFNGKMLNIKNFLTDYYSDKNIKSNTKKLTYSFFSENESIELQELYKSLGKLGKEEELMHLDSIIKRLDKKQNEFYADYKNNCNLYIKLLTILGVGIGVILL